MSALLPPAELPKYVPGEILCASDALGWRGVGVRAYRYTGLDVEVPPLRDFTIVAYRRGGTLMERRFDGRWTRTRCDPGDVSLVTRAQRSHWHWTEAIEVAHIYLAPSLVDAVATDVFDRAVADVRLPDLLRARDSVITRAAEAITAEAAGGGTRGALHAEAVGAQLAAHLLHRYAACTYRGPRAPARLSPAQRRRLVDHIETHLQEPIDLQSLAAVLGLGVWTFSRHFRATFGCAPYAYVIDRRVARACALLAQRGLPIKDVATCCGFADQAHMTRVFRHRLRVTPAAYARDAAT